MKFDTGTERIDVQNKLNYYVRKNLFSFMVALLSPILVALGSAQPRYEI